MIGYARSVLKKFFITPLNAVGFDLVRKGVRPTGRSQTMPIWNQRLELARKLGFSPQVILDGGAFRGLWSKEAASVFPAAQFVVIEPNPFVQEVIAKNVAHLQPSPRILNVALGESPGQAAFNMWNDQNSDTGASLLDHVCGQPRQSIQVQVDTLDAISQRLQLKPDLVKLDLQGAEMQALRGATEVLKHAEVMMIEFGCLDAYIGRATPHDVLQIMYANDYCLYDIVDLGYRPYDGALRGGDFIFVKNSSALRSHKGWE